MKRNFFHSFAHTTFAKRLGRLRAVALAAIALSLSGFMALPIHVRTGGLL
jgi:hypothetical protein